MAVTGKKPDFEDVPPVDPAHLKLVLMMVYAWSDDGDVEDGETMDAETMTSGDLCDLLDRITRRLGVEAAIAIALFKRAIALSTFCAEAELPGTLFENGFPGRELCVAAAKAPVLNQLGETDGEVSHCFDAATMRAALLAAQN
ncbi:MAG: hypothetical protein KGJ79_12690 [Alphaproteobacteria bacterium]|nr:hypothetical protein [Alphaproteobacteria bacterium]MDE2493692.1 hypothetical protein [Alphaproteobacteria bacterium]